MSDAHCILPCYLLCLTIGEQSNRRVSVIACIEYPAVIEKILTHLNENAASAATGLLPEGRVPSPAGMFD